MKSWDYMFLVTALLFCGVALWESHNINSILDVLEEGRADSEVERALKSASRESLFEDIEHAKGRMFFDLKVGVTFGGAGVWGMSRR